MASVNHEQYVLDTDPGGQWDWSRDLRERDGWTEHARLMDSRLRDGFIILGGPRPGEREILHALSAGCERAVCARLAQDNWAPNGMLTITSIEPWTTLLDGRCA